jgi:hypothetical protein
MAQAKKRRRSTKHRGNAVGMIETRGRTGRKPDGSEKKLSSKEEARVRREERMNRPPSWRSAANRAAISSVVLFVVALLLLKQSVAVAIMLTLVALVVYIPIGYYTDTFVYRRKLAKRAG